MMLVAVVVADEEALICDMAETYKIYDYRALPISYIAILTNGLPKTSRVKSNLMGIKERLNTEYLLAYLCDTVTLIRYMLMADPPSINDIDLFVDIMHPPTNASNTQVFRSGADFTAQWNRLTRGN